MEQQLPQFTLSVHHHEDITVLDLRGELDLYGADHLRSVVHDLLDQGASCSTSVTTRPSAASRSRSCRPPTGCGGSSR